MIPNSSVVIDVALREVVDSDLPIFFTTQQDAEANYMIAFGPPDPSDHERFIAKWAKIRADPNTIVRTIEVDGEVAGNILKFELFGQPDIGYWLDRAHWGRGVATRALTAFLALVPERPLFAGVVQDNAGSLRVLQKCGFEIVSESVSFSDFRGVDVVEIHLKLT